MLTAETKLTELIEQHEYRVASLEHADQQACQRLEWTIALLELVHLFRLHKEISDTPEARANPLEHRYSMASLQDVGDLAHDLFSDIFEELLIRLSERKRREGQHTVAEPILHGSSTQCAGVLMQFLQDHCKVDHADDIELHKRWYGSLKILAHDVLNYMAEKVSQVLSTSAPPPLCPLFNLF